MKKGFLLECTRRRSHGASEAEVEDDTQDRAGAIPGRSPGSQSQGTGRGRRGTVYGMYAFPERVRLHPQASVNGGWVERFGEPPEGPPVPVWQEETLSDLNLQMFIEWVHAHPGDAPGVLAQISVS